MISFIEWSLPPSCRAMRAKYRHALRRRRASSYNFAASGKINDFTVNMGHYKLQRPSWNPRGQEIKYVVKERILTRGWPKTYHDAKTLKQQRQRGRVEQLNLFLPKLKSLLALGYSRGNKPNGRAVGSYQMHSARRSTTAFHEMEWGTPFKWKTFASRMGMLTSQQGCS